MFEDFDIFSLKFFENENEDFQLVNKNARLRSSGFRGTFNVKVSTGQVGLQPSLSYGLVIVCSIS